MNASYVLGQANFVSNGVATTQSGMSGPSDVKYDSTNTRVFVADRANNREPVFNVATGSIANGENASNELGHGGTAITQYTTSVSGHSASSFNSPPAVAYDATNSRLFVSDGTNNRVMVFNVAPGFLNDASAVNALGCASLTTVCGGGLTQTGMLYPKNMSYDPNTNRLFVADQGHERVLVFNVGPSVIANGENASYVLGEPDFTTNPGNNNAPNNLSQSGLGLDYSNNQMDCALYDPRHHSPFCLRYVLQPRHDLRRDDAARRRLLPSLTAAAVSQRVHFAEKLARRQPSALFQPSSCSSKWVGAARWRKAKRGLGCSGISTPNTSPIILVFTVTTKEATVTNVTDGLRMGRSQGRAECR